MAGRARVAAILAALAWFGAVAPADAEPRPRTPVRHVISLMQENHSFDNYFGTYPGADGIPKGVCMPIAPTRPSRGCIRPLHIGNRPVEDLSHGRAVALGQYRRGRMDGFISAMARRAGHVIPLVMGHYDDRDLPFYWNVADNYVLYDRFFTSAAGGSVTNHMFWVTGDVGNPKGDFIPPRGFRRQTTIFDRLQRRGISWKFYVQNYDPSITFRTTEIGDRGAQVVWVPLLDYPRYLDNPKLFRHIVPFEQFYDDLRTGNLPSVAYMVPSGSSEHPPGSIRAGETFVRTIINGLMRSSYWKSSAFIWSYDDWGGWYDHVKPPRVDRWGYGFRAPALLVSPYAKRGYVDHTTLDFTSILKFIEDNWGLKPLTARDRRASSLASGLDFARPPRRAVFLTRERHVKPPREPRRSAVYVGYSLALLLTLGFIGFAHRRESPSPQPAPGRAHEAG
jgi:phospholipase C